MTPNLKKFTISILISLAYFVAAKLGLELAFEQVNTSPVWPPTGLAIAALVYFGVNYWPSVFLGAMLVNIATGTSLIISTSIGVGNALEAIIAVWLLLRYTNNEPFTSVINVARFSTIVFFATMISATIGVSSLFLGNVISLSTFPLLWTTWWLGDLVGGLVVAPFLLIWANINKSKIISIKPLDIILLLVTIASILFVFSSLFTIGREHYPLAFIYLPITIWAGYRFGQTGATLFILLISSVAIFATLYGYGPFIRPSENESLLLLQSFMGVMMLATLIITASIEENFIINIQLTKSQTRLKYLVAQQTSDLETAADELKLAESVFNENIGSIIITDKDALILRVNPAFCKVTGYKSSEVIGKNPRFLQSGRHNASFYQDFWKSLSENDYWEGEVWDRKKNGDLFPTWQTVKIVRDKLGNPVQYFSIFNDISDKKVNEEKIFKLAHFDVVSGLHNRSAFHEQLEKAIVYAERHNHGFSLLYLDLDNFKLINDASGHLIGDKLLKYIAERLKLVVRKEDSIARLGGDEFVILVMGTNESKNVSVIAKKVLERISKPILLEHTEIVITSSIGISTYPVDGQDADTLLQNADAAMYKAKEAGRNRTQFFTAEMNAQAQDRLLLESDMRQGIGAGEFLLHYQPQVDIASNSIVGCEALVRWKHPTRGMLSPILFIPIAEESGLIKELGLWVMKEACSQQVYWCNQGLPQLRMAINISSRQFLSQDLISQLKQVIQQTKITPSFLELELTEGSIMEYVEENIEILEHFHQMGVLLAIDDFGTGYSSMAYLKRFPIDKLKIDQSFVKDLATDPDDAAIVKATVLLGHSLHLKVIAEGVETKEQLEYLTSIGCDEIQGYYYSKPLIAEEFVKLISNEINKSGISTKEI
jgi:diguanylate cyclase (GGDEF)-like protein/PAS domain S-box-containing protein